MIGASLLMPAAIRADEAQTLQEVRELKQLMEQQMKRIDELTVEVGRLHQAVAAQHAALAPGPVPNREVGGPPPFSGFTELKPAPAKSEVLKPEPVKLDTPAPTEPPKAEMAGGVKHLVARGETLTSIAKHYNISLAELQKANKDVNDRKLQIGQTLVVPVAKAPETNPAEPTPNEKKENP